MIFRKEKHCVVWSLHRIDGILRKKDEKFKEKNAIY